MRITVRWSPHRDGLPDEQNVELTATHATVADLLLHIQEPREGVLCVRDDTVIPLDARLDDGQDVLLVRTISGG